MPHRVMCPDMSCFQNMSIKVTKKCNKGNVKQKKVVKNRLVEKLSFRGSAIKCNCPVFLVYLILVNLEVNIHLTNPLNFAIPTHKHESTRAEPLSWLSLSDRSCSSPILPGP